MTSHVRAAAAQKTLKGRGQSLEATRRRTIWMRDATMVLEAPALQIRPARLRHFVDSFEHMYVYVYRSMCRYMHI